MQIFRALAAHRHRRPAARAHRPSLARAALIVGIVASTAAVVPPSDADVSTVGRFYVVGSDIVAPDGSKFVPVGANLGVNMVTWSPPTYAFTSQGFTANGRVADALRWGWNTVRVNVVCNPGAGVTLQQTIDGVQRVIDEYTAEGIVVMPECHDLTGTDPTLSHAKFPQIHEFWDAIIARNGTNPYVWVNYLNEPFTTGSSDPRWTALGHTLYERVRAKGSENLFVWDFPGWGQGANDLGAASNDVGPAFVAGRCNVVLSWHNYGAAGDAVEMTRFAQNLVDKRLPVIIGEIGYDWAGSRHMAISYAFEKRGADWTFANVGRFGFGALYWHGTGTNASDEMHSFREAGRGAWYSDEYPLSPGGHQMWNLGWNQPSFARPAVNLADSNCASAQATSTTSTTSVPAAPETPTAAPGPFGKSSPREGAKGRSGTLTLEWRASEGAVGYEYCLDRSMNGACDTSWTSAGAATSATVSGLERKTAFEWQVRAVNAAGTTFSDDGTWWQLTTR